MAYVPNEWRKWRGRKATVQQLERLEQAVADGTGGGGGGDGAVSSVNGKTGAVVLDASDVGALGEDYTPSWDDVQDKPATFAPAAHGHPISDLDTTGSASSSTFLRGDGAWATPEGGGAVDSVNGQTGAVVLDAADVGAVALTGSQTVAGVKTFTSHPVLPGDPTTSLQAATKEYVDDRMSGVLVVESVEDIPPGLPAGSVVLVLEADEPAAPPTVVGWAEFAGDDASEMTFSAPSGVQDGDLLLAFLASQRDAPTSTWTLPEDWVLATAQGDNAETRVTTVAKATASAEVLGDLTFTVSGTPGRVAGLLVAIRGGDAEGVAAGALTGQNGVNVTGPLVVPGVLATSPNSLHLVFATSNGNVMSGHNESSPTSDPLLLYKGGGSQPEFPTSGFTTVFVGSRVLSEAGGSGSVTLTYDNIAQQAGVALVIPPAGG